MTVVVTVSQKKSIDYWPRKQIEYYGNLAVQLIQEDVQLEWTIRQFSITMVNVMC